MATKKDVKTEEFAAEAIKPEVIEAEARDEEDYWNELVPLKIPIDRDHRDDVCISANDRTFHIRRGVEVMVPRNIKEIWEQSQQAEYDAIMKQVEMSDNYAQAARRYQA